MNVFFEKGKKIEQDSENKITESSVCACIMTNTNKATVSVVARNSCMGEVLVWDH